MPKSKKYGDWFKEVCPCHNVKTITDSLGIPSCAINLGPYNGSVDWLQDDWREKQEKMNKEILVAKSKVTQTQG